MPALASLAQFRQAVADFPVEELEVAVEPAARAAAERSLAESGFLLLGEVHGVRENPLIIAALLREFGLTSLALEWPEGLAPVLRELAAAGPLELILIDGVMDAGWSWSQRDEAMARRVLAAPAAAVTTTSRRAGSGRAPVPVPSPRRSSSATKTSPSYSPPPAKRSCRAPRAGGPPLTGGSSGAAATRGGGAGSPGCAG